MIIKKLSAYGMKEAAIQSGAWRLILDGAGDGESNMASDEALLRSVEISSLSGLKPQTVLRLYSWQRPTISIGYGQDAEAFTKLKPALPIVRRITGGRAVLHNSEVTYSLVSPRCGPLYGLGIDGAYSAVSRAIVKAMNGFGVKAEFSPGKRKAGEKISAQRPIDHKACFRAAARHEVTIHGKKAVGSAQRRFKGAFLLHGSILFDVDHKLTARVFGPGLADSISWVGAFSNVTEEEFSTVLTDSIADEFGIDFTRDTLSEHEQYLKKNRDTSRLFDRLTHREK